jgi:hypothetical protein
MQMLGATQFGNAESPGDGSVRNRCKIVGLCKSSATVACRVPIIECLRRLCGSILNPVHPGFRNGTACDTL